MKNNPRSARLSAACSQACARAAVRRSAIKLATAVGLVGLSLAPSARAANATWNGTTDALWATTTNWSATPVPGTGDTATFNNAGGAVDVISLGAGVTVSTILFDTASAAAYTIGSGAVGSQTLKLNHSGAVTLNATVAANQLFNAAIGLGTDATAGTYTFTNNSAANSLTFAGGISGSTGGTAAAKTLTVTGTGATTLSGIIGNGGATSLALTKTGTGTLTLSGVNTYSGTTTLSAGVLRATTSASALGAGTLSLGGGTLQLANNTGLSFGRNTTVTGNTTITSDRLAAGAGVTHTLGTLSIGAQTLTITRGANATSGTGGITFGATTLTGAATFAPGANSLLTVGTVGLGTNTLTLNGAGAMTASGVVSGTKAAGSNALSISNGILTASGANTFTGNIAVDGSGVFAMAGNTFTTTAPYGAAGNLYKQLLLTNGGTFRLTGGTFNNNAPTATNVAAGIIFNVGAGGATFDIASGAQLTIDDGTGTGTASTNAQLQGSGTITKTGLGVFQQDDSAVFTGAMIIAEGTFQPASANAGGATSAGTTIQSGARYNVNGVTMTNQEPLTIHGTGLASDPRGALTNASNTAATWAGPVTLGSAATIGSSGNGGLTLSSTATVNTAGSPLTIAVSGSGRIFTDGVISGTGAMVINNTGAGDYVPRADHTYSGGTTLTAGLVAVDRDSIGTPGSPTSGPFGTGTLTFAGGQMRSGTGPAAGRSIGNAVILSGDPTFFTVAGERNLTFTGPVTLSGGNRIVNSNVGATVATSSTVFSGAVDDGGNNLGLTKTGTGNLLLGGANTYTGGTSVTAGNLLVTGSLANNTGLSVVPAAAGGALVSFVNNAANTPANFSSLALGSAAGTTFLGLDLGTASDSIVTPAAATATNSIGFHLNAASGFGAGTYSLVSAASGLTAGGATYSLGSVPGGYTYAFSNTDSLVQLTATAATPGSRYWSGSLGTSWATFSGVNTTNWATDAAGTLVSAATPGAGDTVFFSATGATGPAIATTVDNSFTINDLQFLSAPTGVASVAINPGVNPNTSGLGTVTLAPSLASTGLTVAQGAGAVTVAAPLTLGAPQTWSVDSSTPGSGTAASLTVSGAISGLAANGLTFTTTAGTTPIILAGAGSTYSGASTISANTIVQGGATNGFSPNTAWTINGTLNTGAFNNNTGSLVGGSGTVQNGSATNATLTIGSDNLASATFSGTIQNGSTGTLGLTKAGTGAQTLSGTNSYTGATVVSLGTLNITGNTTGTGNVTVGNTVGNAVLNVPTGGSLIGTASGTSPTITLGTGGAGSFGALNIAGGTVNLQGTETTDGISFGASNGGYGSFFMDSGSFTQQRFMFGGTTGTTGTGGVGVGLQTGGTVNSTGWMILGRAGASTGVYTITGGTLNHAGASNDIAIGLNGSGRAELNVAGGLLDNTGRRVDFSGGTGGTFSWTGTGVLNLNAGTLLTDAIFYSSGTAYANFNGGTLKASATNASFMNAIGTGGAYVNGAFGTFAGGAVIDTNTFNATIAANLLAPTGDGVTSIPLTSGGSGYIGAPYVQITGGGGSGATGYATIDGLAGAVTGIVITNPGVGYTSAPTVTLVGGGGSGATVGAATLAANVSGGLTKSGAGVLALSGANTFTGNTTIDAGSGTLQIGGAGTLGGGTYAGAISIGTGSTFQYSSSAAQTLSGIISGAGDLLKDTGTGILTLAGLNTYTGNTTLTAGSLNLGVAETPGTNGPLGNQLANAADTIVLNGGTLQYSAANQFDYSGRFSTAASQQYRADTNGQNVTWATDLTSSGGLLVKSGTGTLTLSGTNSYTGATTVSAGELVISGATDTGSATVTVSSGSTLTVATGGSLTTTGQLALGAGTIGNSFAVQSGATVNVGSINNPWGTNYSVDGTLTSTGTWTVSTNRTTDTFNGAGTINASALTLGNASTGVNYSGTGSINLTGAVTVASNGANGNAFYTQTSGTLNAASILLGDNQSNTAGSRTFNLNGGRVNLGSGGIASTGSTTATRAVNLGAGTLGASDDWSSTLAMSLTSATPGVTVDTLDSVDNTTARTVTLSGALSGSGALNKVGAGTLVLSGTSTFAGPVAVTGGLVAFPSSPAISGPLGNSTVVNLDGGGISYTASGTNALNRSVTIGAGTGTLNVASAAGILTVPAASLTSSGGNLVKTGPGTVEISGSTTLNGGAAGVVVNGGTLQGGFGTGGIGSINVGGSGNLSFQNNTIEALILGTSGTVLTLNNGARLGFELNGGTNDSITVPTGGGLTLGGSYTIDFFNTGGGVAANTYTLLTAPAGSGLNSYSYSLGDAPLGFNYSFVTSDTTVQLQTVAYTPIYWRGGQDLSWNTLGPAPANWTTDAAGTSDALSKPVATDTVIFSATGAPTVGNAIATTLDAAFTIDSLQFTSVPAGITSVTVGAGTGGTLTLKPASASGGIAILTGGGNATISAPLTLDNTISASQAWKIVDAGSTLELSGNVAFGANVNKSGAGAVTLGGANSGSGTFSLNAGTLNLNSAGALGTGSLNIAAGTTLNNTSGGAVTLSANGPLNINGDFTFTGSNSLNLGTGAVTLSGNPVATTTAGTLTLGGVVGGASNLTKAGAGTLTLNGNNTFSGPLTLTAGTLNLGHAGALGAGSVVINGGTLDNTSGGALTNANNNPLTVNGGFTFTGSNDLNLGTGAVTLTTTPAIAVSANKLTLAGNISGLGQGLTKTGSGTLELSGSNTYTGVTDVTGGTLNITGSITGNTTTSRLDYGTTAGTTVVNHSGNLTAWVTRGANVAGAVSVFNQTAGTVTIVPSNAQDQQYLANNGGYGMLNITGGTFNTGRFDGIGATSNNASTAVIYVGGTGATLNQNVGDWFLPIRNNGMMSMTIAPGGSFVRSSAVTAQFSITGLSMSSTNNNSYGMLNVAGGSVDTGTKGINFSQGTFASGTFTSTGFVNVAGGTLSLGLNTGVGAAAGTTNGYFNYAGGTLKATANMTAVVPASTANYIFTSTIFGPIDNSAAVGNTSQNFAGGMVVDTQSFSATYGGALLGADGKYGVTQANITIPGAGNSGYAGAPMVQFSAPSGGGVPASGYALISGGQVTGIVITNPGTYDLNETPTVTLTGGGGTIAPFTTSALATVNTSAGLAKDGTGTLVLSSAASTFTGPVVINAGLLQSNGAGTLANIGAASALGKGDATSNATNAASLVLNGGTYSLTGNGAAVTTDRLFTVTQNGGGISQDQTTSGNTVGFTNTAPIAYSGSGARTLTLGGLNPVASTNTFAPQITDAGSDAVTLNKTGISAWLLTNTNSYTGGTNINQGVLAFNSGALGTTGNIAFTGSSTLRWGTGNTDDISARLVMTNAVTSTLDTNGNDVVFASAIGSGSSGSLTKNGAGILTLSGINSYTDSTTINQGTVKLAGGAVLGGAAGSTADANNIVFGLALDSGVLEFEAVAALGAADQIRFRNTGGTAGQGGALVYLGTTNETLSKTIQCDTSIGIRIESNSVGGSLTFNGPFSQTNRALYLGGTGTGNNTLATGFTGTGGVTKRDAGTWILSGANTYSGNTIIDQGTLAFSSDQTLTGGLVFGTTAGGTNTGTLDLGSASGTFASLLVQTNSATANTVTVGSGETLAINGNMTMGYDAGGGTGASLTKLTVAGAGSMSVTGTTINIGTNQAATNAGYWNDSAFDVTGLSAFSTNVTTFNIGVGGNTQGPGTVLLSNTANTIVATTLTVGDTGSNNGRGPGTLTLGTGTNVIQADTINIGRGKNSGNGIVSFASQTAGSPGTVTIANKAGTGAANITVANNNSVATGGGANGTLDLRGHVATVDAGTLLIGQTNSGSNVASTNGTVSFDAGTFTVATLNMGLKTGASTGTAAGTLNVGGGSFTVNSAFTLGSQASAGNASATLNITGGIFTSNVNILDGGGATTSTITLNGGTLDMTGKNIGSATVIDSLNLQSGTLKNVAQINNGGAITKTTTGTLTIDGTNTWTGSTSVSEGTLALASGSGAANSAFTIGGGAATATLDVAGNSTIGPVTTGALLFDNNSFTVAQLRSTIGNLGIDRLTLNGNLGFNGNAQLTLTDIGANDPLPGGTKLALMKYTGFTWDGDAFANYPDNSIFTLGANQWAINYDDTTDGVETGGKFVTLTIATTYNMWAAAQVPALAANSQDLDADGDGKSNELEYGFGTDPHDPGSGPPQIVYTPDPGGSLTTPGAIKIVRDPVLGTYKVVFGRRKVFGPGVVTYTVRFSPDLTNWENGATAPVDVTVPATGDIDAVSVQFPNSVNTPSGPQKPRFAQVVVDAP